MIVLYKTYPTPPRPYSATLDPCIDWRWRRPRCCLRSLRISARTTRSWFWTYGTRTKPLLSTTQQQMHWTLHTLRVRRSGSAMLSERPLGKALQRLAGFVILMVLGLEFDNVRVSACDSADTLSAVLPQAAVRRRSFADKNSSGPCHCPSTIFSLFQVSECVRACIIAQWPVQRLVGLGAGEEGGQISRKRLGSSFGPGPEMGLELF